MKYLLLTLTLSACSSLPDNDLIDAAYDCADRGLNSVNIVVGNQIVSVQCIEEPVNPVSCER